MSKNKLVSYGYVGRWDDGTLGWFVPNFLSKHSTLKRPEPPACNENTRAEKMELCKITIEVVKGRNKRRPQP